MAKGSKTEYKIPAERQGACRSGRRSFGAVQAADDGVAAMASQDSDGSELEKGTSKGCFVAKSYQSDSSY